MAWDGAISSVVTVLLIVLGGTSRFDTARECREWRAWVILAAIYVLAGLVLARFYPRALPWYSGAGVGSTAGLLVASLILAMRGPARGSRGVRVTKRPE